MVNFIFKHEILSLCLAQILDMETISQRSQMTTQESLVLALLLKRYNWSSKIENNFFKVLKRQVSQIREPVGPGTDQSRGFALARQMM